MKEDATLRSTLEHIKKHALQHPENAETIITELNSICNKFDPDIIENRKDPLPLISSEFNLRMDETLQKIKAIVGDDVKVPDLRFCADDLSRDENIPLPSSTRKHKESLLQWFDAHWEYAEPMLIKWKKNKRIK